MKISKIKIKNYGPYYGQQIIDVPYNKEQNIVVLIGENGSGKTNLINCLVWCLYDSQNIDYSKLLNDRRAFELEKNCKEDISVEIHFEHNGISHIAKRVVAVMKKDDSTFTNGITLFNISKITTEAKEQNIDNPELYINNILSESVKNYFFFDGSRIEIFTQPNHDKEVENAIKKLLKIETIQRARSNVETFTRELRSIIQKNDKSKELEKINGDISELNSAKTETENTLKEQKTNLREIERTLTNISKEISDLEKTSLLNNKLEDIRKNLTSEKNRMSDFSKDLKIYLKESYLLFLGDLFEKNISYINNLKKFNTIPNNVIKEIIRKTITERNCYVCKREVDEFLAKIMEDNLVKIHSDSNEEQEISNFANDVIDLKSAKDNLKNKILDTKQKIIEVEKLVKKLSTDEEGLMSKINSGAPDLNKLKDIQKTNNDNRDKLIGSIKVLETKLDTLSRRIKEEEEKFQEAQILNKKSLEEGTKLKQLNKVKLELDRIYKEYELTEIKTINFEMKKIFDLIIRKEDVFKEIYIDNNYKLTVTRENSKYNTLEQLSYGERQILSLSLIIALANVSGDSGPFVMDTPMGNLDPIHRQKLVKQIPQNVNQLFLLVTSSEFTPDLYNLCSNSISAIYRLQNDNGTTKITKEEMHFERS